MCARLYFLYIVLCYLFQIWCDGDLWLLHDVEGVNKGFCIFGLDIYPSADVLYSCGEDGRIRAWNSQLKPLEATKQCPAPAIGSREMWKVRVDAKSGRLYSLDNSGNVRIYKLETDGAVSRLTIGEKPGPEKLNDIAVHEDYLFTIRENEVVCYEITQGRGKLRVNEKSILQGHVPIGVGEQSTLVAFGTQEHSLVIHEIDPEKEYPKKFEVKKPTGGKLLGAVCFSPDGSRLYSGGADNCVTAWRLDGSGKTLKPDGQPVRLRHVVNFLAASSTAVFAASSEGHMTKIALT